MCFRAQCLKMAATDDDILTRRTTFSVNDNINWVPLTLTLVEYPQGDLLGKFLAFVSLLPFGIISGLVGLILFRRDLHTIAFLAGTCLNEILNIVLKHIFCEARPILRNTQSLYNEYGMPSSHSQFMWFYTTYLIYFVFIRLYHTTNNTFIENVWKSAIILLSVFMAALVTISRVYLQYHSWNQVFYGALTGFTFGTFWFFVTHLILTPIFPYIVSWRISEFLLLRDTTLIPNVLWFEYTNSRQEARARSRKLVSMKSQ